MGSSSSKTRRIGGDTASATSSYCSSPSSTTTTTTSTSSRRRTSGKSRGVFGSSCLGSSSAAYHSDDDDDDHQDQVRALQRLGNRFENLSGHERSCILSGQHRTGRCSCRIGSRDSNLNGDGGARASISRIVMLAEALFEVLDEIHQQSVVLSARPSVSSIGSVPAPNEVVESLPVKVYKSMKFQCEEVGQCYICLVEYEEGDEMRILPCQHEFHKKCIDKWLKEIHRVCPLCRGDICRSDSSPVES